MLQFAGFWMGLATFVGIWWGHVGVRWLEAHSRNIWPPIIVLAVAGILLNVFSVMVPALGIWSNPDVILTLSGVASIIGITLMWDAFEMYRQQNRVKKGHAPVNPNNPRHAAYLAAGIGTTEDLLDREPQGFPVTHSTPVPRHPAAAVPATNGSSVTAQRNGHAPQEAHEEEYAEVRV
ncbi:MAG: DUF4491 family protein [Chloroflexaceae bacterium]|nr:DUF4491 family protein [Chloroflexaceae bacterium]NJO04796.1 DUF4491 family protein [Chloroflexaceae bacterium]